MKLGSLIIYDNDGNIFLNTGDMEGDVLPHKIPNGLPYILTEYGELKNKIVKCVDVKSKKLVIENIPKEKSKDEQIQELENKLLLEKENQLGGII